MKLSDLLTQKFIINELSSENKSDIIDELVDLFKNDERIIDLEKVRASVHSREKIMSTGVGKNFAIPHGKTDAVNDIICAFAKSSKPINFESLDGQAVHLLFLLIGKDNLVSLHIKLLSRISRMMTKDHFREKLMKATSSEEIIQIFREEENSYFEL